MIRIILLLLILTSANYADASERIFSDKEQLQQLLKERKDRFDTYMHSLQNKSGLFGGKTKKDLLKSQEILVEIVRLDNKMISVLNRQLDYKNFEKTEMTYNSMEDYEKQDRLESDLATSRKALAELRQKQTRQLQIIRVRTLIMVLALLAAVLAFILPWAYLRKKENALRTDGTSF